MLGPIFELFRRDNPDVDIVLREMNMADLHHLLDQGLLDYVFGVAEIHKKRWHTAFLYDEPLLFIPRALGPPSGPRRESVNVKDISNETYVMVPDACGLSHVTRALFRSQKRKLKEYSGEAISYQVLQDWAELGIGAASCHSQRSPEINTLSIRSRIRLIGRFESRSRRSGIETKLARRTCKRLNGIFVRWCRASFEECPAT